MGTAGFNKAEKQTFKLVILKNTVLREMFNTH